MLPDLPSPASAAVFWTRGPEALCGELQCGLDGLGSADAARRLERFGLNGDAAAHAAGALRAVLRRLLEPLCQSCSASG
ncbi:cation-transporting P-type ATPase [Methylobacterium mesophilicum]